MERNGFNMQFAFLFNEFSQKMNKLLKRVFKFGLNTVTILPIAFAENNPCTI